MKTQLPDDFGIFPEGLVEVTLLQMRAGCMPQVDALMAAGWKFELPEIVNHNPPRHNWSNIRSEPWQWYWRSPPMRKNSKGRKYWSTQQAFTALSKSNHDSP